MSDSAGPSVTSSTDITSIVKLLEENPCFFQNSVTFTEIESRFNEITNWVNMSVLSAFLTNSEVEKNRCFLKMKEFQKACKNTMKMMKTQTVKVEVNTLRCVVCDAVVSCPKRSFWENLQDHEHIEMLWANYLAGTTEIPIENKTVTAQECYGISELDFKLKTFRNALDMTHLNRIEIIMERGFQSVLENDHLRYDSDIMNFCYPEDLMREAYQLDGVPEFTLQYRGTFVACLLCRIPRLEMSGSFIDHMRGAKHQNNAYKNQNARTALHTYHAQFSELPPDFQAHIIYFYPRNGKHFFETRCQLCKTNIHYTSLKSHILSLEHKHALLNSMQNKRQANREYFLLNKAYRVYNDVTVTDDALQLPSTSKGSFTNESPRSITSEDTDVRATTIDLERLSVEDKPAEFKFNFSVPQDEVDTSPTPISAECISYDETIVNICYPKHVSSLSSQLDGIPEYTIQFKSESEAFCLLCLCPIEGRLVSIKLHIRGTRHQKYANDRELVKSIAAYHAAFMCMPPELQTHVIYFCPFTEAKTKCCVCAKSCLLYSSLEKHIFSHKHRTVMTQRFHSGKYNREVLLKKAVAVYINRNFNCERSDESGSNLTDSPARNGLTENNSDKPKTVHDVVKSVTNTETTDIFEQLENRFRSHLNLLEESMTQVFCKCCSVTILKTVHEVKKHLISEAHKQKAGVATKKYKFVCYICSAIYSKEASWQDHFNSVPHRTKCEEIPVNRRNNLTEYECRTCNVILFGDSFSVKTHQKMKQTKLKRNKVITLSDKVKIFFQSENYINNIAIQLALEANNVVICQDNVWACCKALEAALSKIFPNCRAYPFGSRVSGLGNQNSDLDVFVDVGDMYLGNSMQDAKSQERIVKDACKIFKSSPGRVFTHINPIPTARTPIIQVFHTLTQLDCDLSFRHGLSVENTKFLRVCISLQPVTQHMVLMLKQWSQYSKMDEHISTYALAMMVIFYLQTKNHLLSVKQLKTLNPEPAVIIDGWETIHYTLDYGTMKSYITPYTETLKQLLIDFFKYYAEFKYETDVVCPLLGNTILKTCFNNSPSGDLLPPEMQSYVKKLKTEKDPELFRSLSPFCVQDPFDLSHNLTKACSLRIVTKLKTLCELTVKHLEAIK